MMKKFAFSTLTMLFLFYLACAPAPQIVSIPSGRAIPQVRVLLQKFAQSMNVSATEAFAIKNEDNGQDLSYVSQGQKIAFKRIGDKIEVAEADGKVLGNGTHLLCHAKSAGCLFQIGGNSYRGQISVFIDNADAMVVNTLDLESYLMGVVKNEIGKLPQEQMEAAKAQAVAARTYAIKNKNKYKIYDYVSDIGDQVYNGASSESDVSNRAVIETLGETLEFEGKPIQAFFYSTSGGTTSNVEDVWKSSTPVPYLRTISTFINGKDLSAESPNYRWEVKWTGPEIEDLVKANLPIVLKDQFPIQDSAKLKSQKLLNLLVMERDSSQRIKTFKIGFTKDNYTVTGEQIRRILKGEKTILYSSLFKMDIARDSTGSISTATCKGGGYGHGVGMCQWSARTMAKEGYSYKQILGFFYRGTTIGKAY